MAKKKKQRDIAEIAYQTVQGAIQEVEHSKEILQSLAKEKNPAAVALGRLGGLRGGPARAKKLSPGRRKEIAQEAAKKRWSKKKKGE